MPFLSTNADDAAFFEAGQEIIQLRIIKFCWIRYMGTIWVHGAGFMMKAANRYNSAWLASAISWWEEKQFLVGINQWKDECTQGVKSSQVKSSQVAFNEPVAIAQVLQQGIQFLLPLKIVPPYTVSSTTSSITSYPSSLTIILRPATCRLPAPPIRA